MDKMFTYNGVWTIPGDNEWSSQHFSGTLSYYGDRNSVLELIHKPNSGATRLNQHYDVIWGTDARMQKYTLFGASLTRNHNFTCFEFAICFILIGEHVGSLDDNCFAACTVKYSYLNRWAMESRIKGGLSQNKTHITLDFEKRPPFFSVKLDDNLEVALQSQLVDSIDQYSVSATQTTNLQINSSNPFSINGFLKTIGEFSQFLSIALFSEQYPFEVSFDNKKSRTPCHFLFRRNASDQPWVLPLIKFNDLEERMYGFYKTWHENYSQINPICSYLIRSIKHNTAFDAPDFLIVAQALDGFFKRFVNNRAGKDYKKYKDQIQILVNRFKDVDLIKGCKLDPSVVEQTRHKYSHLIPDDDEKITMAVDGEELYWLTQKCIVLLTCCILDMLGLTTDEINLCCNNSPVQQIVEAIPFWPD